MVTYDNVNRLKFFICFLSLTMALCGVSTAARQVIVPPEGSEWLTFAEKYLLVYKEGRPFSRDLDKANLRCIKMNNYGCLWQRNGNWKGTPGPDGTDGAHDGAGGNSGHAIFVHPKWSIVASYTWFSERTDEGRKHLSGLELASKYAPWCDTIGSAGTRADDTGRLWGRGCKGGKQPPPGFKGPMCGRPSDGKPSKAQCQACNCPPSIAKFWLRGSGHEINDPLTLFDDKGKPTETMQSILPWKIGLETGRYKPTIELIKEAGVLFNQQ